MKLMLHNGRYEGRLADGRLLCVLPDVFEMNRGEFPDEELYDPDEWLSSVDGENCWIEEKQGVGRPSNPNRKQRINVTLSPDTLAELEQRIPLKQRSAFIERLVRRELGLETK